MNTSLKMKLVAMATAALGFTAIGCGGSDAEETPAGEEGGATTGGEGQASCGEQGCTAGHEHGGAAPAGGGEAPADPAAPPPAEPGVDG